MIGGVQYAEDVIYQEHSQNTIQQHDGGNPDKSNGKKPAFREKPILSCASCLRARRDKRFDRAYCVLVRRPSSSLARERTYSGSQRRTRCGSSTRSTLYDVWPFTYWFIRSFPSSSSPRYWLTVYSWSCPPRPPSSPPSEYPIYCVLSILLSFSYSRLCREATYGGLSEDISEQRTDSWKISRTIFL